MKQMYRLRLRKDIETVVRRGSRMDTPLLRAVALKNNVGHLRLALVVSRATEKHSVARNRIRRRAREWVRTHPDTMALPFDLVFIFKKQAATLLRKEFYDTIAEVCASLSR